MAEIVKTDPQIVNVRHVVTEEDDGIAVPVLLSGNYVDVDSPLTDTQDQYSSSVYTGDISLDATEEDDLIKRFSVLRGNFVSPVKDTQDQYSSSIYTGDISLEVTEEDDVINRSSVLSGNSIAGKFMGCDYVNVVSPVKDMKDQYSTGDLSPVTEEYDLISKFSPDVSGNSVTGKSMGGPYVVSPLNASNAMACLDDLKGKTMPINWSDERHLAYLYVENLDSSITSSCLQRMFSPFGTILSCQVAEEDGHSKCFGYVQFDTQQSAIAACGAFNGSMVHGKKLFVDRFIKTDQTEAVSAENQEYPPNLYVDNLMGDATEDFLQGIFSWFGRISSVVIMRDGMGRSRGFGFVSFCHPDSAKKAIKSLNGLQIGSNKLFVGWALTKAERMEMLKQPYTFNTKEFNLYVNNLSESVGFVGLSSIDESELSKRELNGSLIDGKSPIPSLPACYMINHIQEMLIQHQRMNTWVGIVDANGTPTLHYRLAPIVVFWDIENCMVPAGCHPSTVRDRITYSLRQQGYLGYVHIIAVAANIHRVPLFVQEGLYWCGIPFCPLNTQEKQASDVDIRWRIQIWMESVTVPGNILLISGDGGFAPILMDLERNLHNTMIAYNDGSVSELMTYVGYTQFLWRELLLV